MLLDMITDSLDALLGAADRWRVHDSSPQCVGQCASPGEVRLD